MAGEANGQEQEEEEYVVVLDDDNPNPKGEGEIEVEGEGEIEVEGEGAGTGAGEGNLEEEEEERVAGHGDNEETDEERRDRRRIEGRERRQRQKDARDRDQREMALLRTRNETLERRFSDHAAEVDQRMDATELNQIDTSISNAQRTLNMANDVMSKAISDNNGEDYTEALNYRDQARDQLKELQDSKKSIGEKSNDTQPYEYKEEVLDRAHVEQAEKFMGNHGWWDPAGGDEDSRTVLRLDQQLMAEHYNPSTPEYWSELDKRTRAALPTRFEARQNDTSSRNGKKRSSGPQFRTGGRERPLKKNEVHISKERLDAMEQAGITPENDPVAFKKMVKRYAEYDRDAANQGGA